MKPLYQLTACLLISFVMPCVAAVAQVGAAKPPAFTVAVASAPRTLDPATATDAAGARLLQLTHPALLGWDTAYRPAGQVAQSCRMPSLTQAVCTLPPSLTFTDGSPLTAPDVAAWFGQLQANKLSPFVQLKDVKVTAPTRTTLQFDLPAANLGFLGALTEVPVAKPQRPEIGAGPYKIVSHDATGSVTLATDRADMPSTLTFIPLSDATTRLLKLKKGEVDAVLNDLPPQLVNWAKAEGFPVVAVPGSSYSYIGLNLQNTNLKHPAVREALTLAINRAALRTHLLGGMATPASTLLPPGHPAAWPAPEEAYDPFSAESLLDEANLLPDGTGVRFRMTLLTSTDPFSQRVSQAIQAQLQEIGVAVDLRPTEWASFYDSVKKGAFDAVMLAWTGEQQPSFYQHAFHSAQVPPAGLNRGRLNDPQVDAATDAIMAAKTEAEQVAATVQVQKLLADVRPYIPLYRRHQVLVTRPEVTGCGLTTSGNYLGLVSCRK
ncbi:MAG: hypothetical protein DI585_00115 [Pseudomonas fluorescens]|nr:MAG: hypothetical protein DI585_00115 [Pseudomonas fluorescens]